MFTTNIRRIIFGLLFLSATYVQAQSFSLATQQKLQAIIDARFAQNTEYKAGISAAIHANGVGYWEGTSGVSSMDISSSKLTTDTLFMIYSTTKSFTAALILDLVAEGKISLSDKISKWTMFQNFSNINSEITIEQMLTHSSGIGDYVTNLIFQYMVVSNPSKQWQPVEMLYYTGMPVFEPGKGQEYSSSNYIILGLIAENVTDSAFNMLLRKRYFEPLGMTNTWFLPQEQYIGNLANPHDKKLVLGQNSEEVVDLTKHIDLTGLMSVTWSTGGIVSNPRDVIKWADALYTGRATSDAAYEMLMASTKTDSHFGYGVYKKNHVRWGAIGHNGGAVGYRSSMTFIPEEKISISVIVNQGILCISEESIDAIAREMYLAVSSNPLAGLGSEIESNSEILVYPNPAGSYATISFLNKNMQEIELQLVNAIGISGNGNVLHYRKIKEGEWQIQTEELATGYYVLQMITNTGIQYKTLIKN